MCGIDILGCAMIFLEWITPREIVEKLKTCCYGNDKTLIHVVLKINTAKDGTNTSGYVHLIDFTISSTEMDKSAFDIESDNVLCSSVRVFFDLKNKFPLLKDSKNKFKLVYFGK